MNEKFFSLLLFLHILGGSIGLLCGLLVFILKKGTSRHANLGRLFILGMLLTGITAQLMAFIRPNAFLFMVGVFTIYQVGTGARAIYSKSFRAQHSIDRFLQFGMVIAGLSLIYLGIKKLWVGDLFGIVFVVFAGIGILMALQDIRSTAIPHDKKAYIRKHLQRLGGGFIASATAFLVVNIRELPDWMPVWTLWLLPTVLLSPLISYHSRKYTSKPSTPTR